MHVFSQPHGKKILPKVPGALLKECQWLKFGPHASDWKHPLNTQTAKEQISEVNHVYKEIGRIAGKKSFVKSARLHFFQGSKDACLLLAKKGVEVLFTTDFFKDRFGYCLSPDSRTDLNNKGYYFDKGTKILFVKSSFRVECRDDIIKDTEEYLKDHGFCVFYTHEEFLIDPVMQKRIKDVLAFCQKKNIPFVV